VEQLLRSMATSLATFGTWRRSPSRLSAVRTTSDLRRWGSRLGESNSGPTHYECVALPTELRRPAAAPAVAVATTRKVYRLQVSRARQPLTSAADLSKPGFSRVGRLGRVSLFEPEHD
jgi:hypothetical protein